MSAGTTATINAQSFEERTKNTPDIVQQLGLHLCKRMDAIGLHQIKITGNTLHQFWDQRGSGLISDRFKNTLKLLCVGNAIVWGESNTYEQWNGLTLFDADYNLREVLLHLTEPDSPEPVIASKLNSV